MARAAYVGNRATPALELKLGKLSGGPPAAARGDVELHRRQRSPSSSAALPSSTTESSDITRIGPTSAQGQSTGTTRLPTASSLVPGSTGSTDVGSSLVSPTVALQGFQNYDLMRQAGCQKDPSTFKV
ncbi:hypothetical protein OIO90_006352 [Microbotryomycetes sp. JL221]|nr:hypothetical protein OIO90_006352 [Microbotryomycetes sp. JL221]